MVDPLLLSNVLLWVLVLAMAVMLMALARQIGLLHERSAPLGAVISDKGPDIGDQAPEFELKDYWGNLVKIGGAHPERQDTLLLFLAPNCPMCNKLLPTVLSMARSEHLDVVIISDGPYEEHQDFLQKHAIGTLPYVISADVGIRFQVGRVPYAILLDQVGTISSKGLVNTREHLESLVEAKVLDVTSIQEYLKVHSQTEHDHDEHTIDGQAVDGHTPDGHAVEGQTVSGLSAAREAS